MIVPISRDISARTSGDQHTAMERWAGRTAVVTGASAGIGAAVARALADAGLRVVAAARRYHLLEELQNSVKGKGCIIPVECDMAKPEDLVKLMDAAKAHGGVDVLVNNAALLYNGTVSDYQGSGTSLEDIEQCFNVNVMAVIRATRLAVADMVQRNVPGLIIMINSIAGHKVPSVGDIPDNSVYTATKYAVTALCETLRLEFSYSRLPIRISSLSPGAVDTQMLHNVVANNPLIKNKIPMLNPKDIADAVLFLLSTPDTVNISEMTVQVAGEQF